MVGFVATSPLYNAVPVRWHYHEQYEIMLFLRGGSAYEFKDGTEFEIGGGQFMVTPPGLSHRAKRDVRTPSLICAITFDMARSLTASSPFTKHEKEWIKTQLRDCAPHPQSMSPEMQRPTQWLHQIILKNRKSSPTAEGIATIRLLTSLLILEAARHAGGNPLRDPINAVSLATSYMETQFAAPLRMATLAQKAECSRAQLFAVFKRETGMSPNDWLQRLRVRKAEVLLTSSDDSLTEIALSVGFSSHQYFCHVFRKYTGKTPGEHRSLR